MASSNSPGRILKTRAETGSRFGTTATRHSFLIPDDPCEPLGPKTRILNGHTASLKQRNGRTVREDSRGLLAVSVESEDALVLRRQEQ
jgi:hypothetical protein